MRTTATAALAILLAAHGAARADDEVPVTPPPPPPPHNTGFMLELRYSPELDVEAYPISNNFIAIGYLDRRFGFALTFGLNRVTSDDPNGGNALTTTYLTIGPTVRGSFFETADGTTELVGEGTATYTSVGMDSDTTQAIGTPSPLRFELGIGVRHWIVPELAIGAAALVRYTTAQVGPQSLSQESLGGALYLTGAL